MTIKSIIRTFGYSSLAAFGVMLLPISSANAADYFNCATPTGCKLVQSKRVYSNYDKTKYPIVMAHGFFGWSRMLGSLDYFNGVPQTLMKNGATVFTTKTSSVNSSEVRGEQLLKQVAVIQAVTGAKKVNLFGHSQGGLDARYVAGVAPDRVASVTSVSSPHKGSKTTDYLIKVTTDKDGKAKLNRKILAAAVEAVGVSLDVLSGVPLKKTQAINAQNVMDTTSSANIQAFNDKYPAALPSSYCGQPPRNNVVNGIGYFSWTGNTTFTNIFDASDYTLSLTGLTFEGEPNDGLVGVCSSRMGYVIRDNYRMNHLDTINQLFGITSWREVNPLSVYRTQVNRLKKQGY